MKEVLIVCAVHLLCGFSILIGKQDSYIYINRIYLRICYSFALSISMWGSTFSLSLPIPPQLAYTYSSLPVINPLGLPLVYIKTPYLGHRSFLQKQTAY